jgi:hypothetical protein
VRRAHPIFVLLGGAALVVGGIVGLGSLSFGELLAEATVPDTPAGSTPGGAVEVPDGGILHVSGDRTGTLTLSNTDVGFGDSTTPWSSPDGMEAALGWQSDADVGLYLDHFRLDELDFFLDPGECVVTPGAIPATGQVPVSVECQDIGDIREKAVISVDGVVNLPFTFVAPPGVVLGGEFTVDGDMSATVQVPAPHWVIDPDAANAEFAEPEVQAVTQMQDAFFSISLDRDDSGALFVSFFQYHDFELGFASPFFQPAPGDCTVSETLVETTGPASAVYDLTIECPSLTSVDEVPEGMSDPGPPQTISLYGELTGHRLEMEPGEE